MADLISSFLNNYGSQILSAGMSYLANQDSASRATDVNTRFGGLNAKASEALIDAYTQNLAAQEGLKPTINNAIEKYADDRTANLEGLYEGTGNALDNYSLDLYRNLGSTDAEYTSGAGDYSGQITGAYESSIPYLESGYQGYEQAFTPYVAGGEDAQNFLRDIMSRDPSELTPSQQRLYERFLREANANVNASGLRGAGRAGVAAVNEGLADFYANMYDQNLNRSTAAADSLNQTGYGAAGATGGARKDLGEQMTQLTYGTGEKLAENARRLGDIRGDLTYSTGKQTADTRLQAGTKLQDTAFNTAQDLAKERLGTTTSLESGLATARGDTALGVGTTKAQALINQGISDADKSSVENYNRGKTFSQISDIFAGAKQKPVI